MANDRQPRNGSVSTSRRPYVYDDFAEDVIFEHAPPRVIVPLHASATVCTFTVILDDADATEVEIPDWPVGKDLFVECAGIKASPTNVDSILCLL